MKRNIRYVKNFFLALFLIIAALLLKLFFWDVPSLRHENPKTTCYMERHEGPKVHKWVPIKRISRYLAQAVVASEDSQFYSHHGIDFDELSEAFKHDMKKGSFGRGGSTIPMQLAKNLYLSPHKNVARKTLELILALKIDFDLTKERTLEIYLNVVEWGDGIYGAEAAAEHYFKKPAAELTAYEAAYLAAILPSPVKWGAGAPGPYVRTRVSTILARMGAVPDLPRSSVPSPKSKTESPKPTTENAEVPKVIKLPASAPAQILPQAQKTPAPVVPQAVPSVEVTTPPVVEDEAPKKTIFLDENQ